PDVEIIIHGHVNVPNAPPLPEASFHYKLSERRALHVMDFLIGNRIAPERLSWEAHCNWEMLYPKTVSEGQQAANRRVEIEVK
ncbi:MAG: hypothetical protein HRU12_03630, partial [Phaeodactylibacter sp.]|nr:hypothetical protein [Phaeodactylibacter sp.]